MIPAMMDDEQVAVLYDPGLDEGRAFVASSGGRQLSLEPGRTPGTFVDSATGGTWAATGQPIERGDPLEPLAFYDVMWFSWVAFFPDTEVVA